jgi:hypothetical protein
MRGKIIAVRPGRRRLAAVIPEGSTLFVDTPVTDSDPARLVMTVWENEEVLVFVRDLKRLGEETRQAGINTSVDA